MSWHMMRDPARPGGDRPAAALYACETSACRRPARWMSRGPLNKSFTAECDKHAAKLQTMGWSSHEIIQFDVGSEGWLALEWAFALLATARLDGFAIDGTPRIGWIHEEHGTPGNPHVYRPIDGNPAKGARCGCGDTKVAVRVFKASPNRPPIEFDNDRLFWPLEDALTTTPEKIAVVNAIALSRGDRSLLGDCNLATLGDADALARVTDAWNRRHEVT